MPAGQWVLCRWVVAVWLRLTDRCQCPHPLPRLLLEGFECFDDGVSGERVTPTGAVIYGISAPTGPGAAVAEPWCVAARALVPGSLPGLSNVLRLLAYEEAKPVGHQRDRIAEILFEV